ncbi:hypothetical protein [Pseudomonas sp. GM49]|uniref:hypothetical protein n=1 Tax=Pseudomonas sp. GM49 TaxID=1144331 RepID=UPI0009D96F0D|nr:hypothetical protein [Pseudomonas sp. GM49]
MAAARDQGKTRVIGVSNFDSAQLNSTQLNSTQLKQAQAVKEIVSLQPRTPPCGERLQLTWLHAITAIKKNGPLAPITSFLGDAAFQYIGCQIR